MTHFIVSRGTEKSKVHKSCIFILLFAIDDPSIAKLSKLNITKYYTLTY